MPLLPLGSSGPEEELGLAPWSVCIQALVFVTVAHLAPEGTSLVEQLEAPEGVKLSGRIQALRGLTAEALLPRTLQSVQTSSSLLPVTLSKSVLQV